jgi:hypothetical protein
VLFNLIVKGRVDAMSEFIVGVHCVRALELHVALRRLLEQLDDFDARQIFVLRTLSAFSKPQSPTESLAKQLQMASLVLRVTLHVHVLALMRNRSLLCWSNSCVQAAVR